MTKPLQLIHIRTSILEHLFGFVFLIFFYNFSCIKKRKNLYVLAGLLYFIFSDATDFSGSLQHLATYFG